MTALIFLYVLPLVFVFLFVSWSFYFYDIVELFYERKDIPQEIELWKVLIFIMVIGIIPLVNIWLTYFIINELSKEDYN